MSAAAHVSTSSSKKVRITPQFSTSSSRKHHFGIDTSQTTLHRLSVNYGKSLRVGGASTPFTKAVQSLDVTYLRDRLMHFISKQRSGVKHKDDDEDDDEDEDELEDEARPPTSDLSYSITYSPPRDQVKLSFLSRRKQFEKGGYTLAKSGFDMTTTMHDPGPSIPGVSIKFPTVSLPTEYHDDRLTVLFDTEV